MLESEENVLTWIGSNVCTCSSESKHFAVHLFDTKRHLPMGLQCLLGVVVWMHCAYVSFVDWLLVWKPFPVIYCRSALSKLNSVGWKWKRSQTLWKISFKTGEKRCYETFSMTSRNEMFGFRERQKTPFRLEKWENDCISNCVFQKKVVPLEKYTLIKLFIPRNCGGFHGLDYPVLFLPSITSQFQNRCNRVDSVSAPPGVKLTQWLVT